MNEATLTALVVEAERTNVRRAEGAYGTANAEWWPVIEPDEVLWLVAEVRRLRAELLKRNIPLAGCQCACHGCQWCEC